MPECSVNQAMIGNTRGKVIVLADFSKIQHVSNFVSAPLDDIDVVVTDDKTPDAVIDNLKARNIEVYVV
jgi:DeoR/GlpR family transcriptional regulator of sugar metabolism